MRGSSSPALAGGEMLAPNVLTALGSIPEELKLRELTQRGAVACGDVQAISIVGFRIREEISIERISIGEHLRRLGIDGVPNGSIIRAFETPVIGIALWEVIRRSNDVGRDDMGRAGRELVSDVRRWRDRRQTLRADVAIESLRVCFGRVAAIGVRR